MEAVAARERNVTAALGAQNRPMPVVRRRRSGPAPGRSRRAGGRAGRKGKSDGTNQHRRKYRCPSTVPGPSQRRWHLARPRRAGDGACAIAGAAQAEGCNLSSEPEQFRSGRLIGGGQGEGGPRSRRPPGIFAPKAGRPAVSKAALTTLHSAGSRWGPPAGLTKRRASHLRQDTRDSEREGLQAATPVRAGRRFRRSGWHGGGTAGRQAGAARSLRRPLRSDFASACCLIAT